MQPKPIVCVVLLFLGLSLGARPSAAMSVNDLALNCLNYVNSKAGAAGLTIRAVSTDPKVRKLFETCIKGVDGWRFKRGHDSWMGGAGAAGGAAPLGGEGNQSVSSLLEKILYQQRPPIVGGIECLSNLDECMERSEATSLGN